MLEEMSVLDATLLMVVRFIAILVVLTTLMVCLYLFGFLYRVISERRQKASGTQEPSG